LVQKLDIGITSDKFITKKNENLKISKKWTKINKNYNQNQDFDEYSKKNLLKIQKIEKF